LVLSFDSLNKFPTRDKFDYHSKDEFSTDSILVTQKMLKEYAKSERISKVSQIYLGIYTEGPLSIYSVLVSKKTDFNPIKLSVGQIQSGKVPLHEKKFFYFQTSIN
jgi:hypothetical protein